MKMKKLHFFLMFIIFFVVISSCRKPTVNTPSELNDIDNLVVSNNFNWESSSNNTFLIKKSTSGIIKITSEDGNILYHKGFHNIINPTYDVSLNIPKYVEHVLVNNHLVDVNESNTINVDLDGAVKQTSGKSSALIDGLIAFWQFNETSGDIVYDSEGGSNGYVFGAQREAGVVGNSLNFNGSDNYVSLSSANEDLSSIIADAGTISFWTKINQKSSPQYLFHCYDNANKKEIRIEYKAYSGASDQIRFIYKEWGYRYLFWNPYNSVPVQAGDNEWHQFVMNWDNSTNEFKVYIDGDKYGNTVDISNANWAPSIDEITFGTKCTTYPGAGGNPSNTFNGSIDEVKMYDYALSGVEIFDGYGAMLSSDADEDGVNDDYDDYPNDPDKAFDNYSPAAGYGSLIFEDLWPGRGDYDFNDLVLDYQFKIVTDASNKVTDVVGSFVVRAIGAGLSNGFGFQFPNNNVQSADINVSGSVLSSNYITLNENGTEANQNKPTIIVFDNAKDILQSSSGFGVNVTPGAPYIAPVTLTVSMAFTPNIYTVDDIDLINFNPFLIVDETRGKEIHLADYQPTSLADESYFGTMNDDSNPSTGKYYKTENNLPWAIKIPESFDYTIEKSQITNAYLKSYDWAHSSGSVFLNWYQAETGYRNDSDIYSVPEK